MKLLSYFRAAGAGFALVLLGGLAYAAVSPYWGAIPGVTGPWLGDSVFNINSIWTAYNRDAGHGAASITVISQVGGQANCTQLPNDAFIELKTSASFGGVCLPSAIMGKGVHVGNATGQTISMYTSATSAVSGTADTINGTVGTTPYTTLTSGKSSDCFAANTGAWYCSTAN